MRQRAVVSTQMNWFSEVGILCASPSQDCTFLENFTTFSTNGTLYFTPAVVSTRTILPNCTTTACSPSVRM